MGLEDNKKIMDIFTGNKIYKVPPYQRDYSWKKSQIEDFWNDALDFFESGEDSYFFGPVVFVEEPKKSFVSIVDGQQRLTTLQLLICVIRDILYSNKEHKKAAKCDQYLVTRMEELPLLELNNNNNPFFSKFALKENTPENKIKDNETKKHSEIKLYDNYKRLYRKIKERFLKNQGIEKQNSNVYDFLTKILKGFRVFEITLDSPEKAFRLFATLNHRGLSLTTSDLIKNLIFMNSNESQHSSFHATWESIRDNLEDKNGFDQFLRHSFIAKYKYVTTQSLYNEVVDKNDSAEKVREYLDNLLTDSQIYSEIVSTKRDDTTGFYLKSLFKDLNNDSAQSVILNAHKFWKDNPKDIDKIIKICLDIFFRGKTIGGKAAGMIGKQFAKAAKLIASNVDFDVVIEELKLIDIPNHEFENAIKNNTFQDTIAKYLLKTIERFYLSNPTTETKGTISTVTLEHILPQKIEYEKNGNTIKTDWLNKESESYVSKNDHEKFVNRIGNLTLLHKLKNSELQNLSFEEKKKKYTTETGLEITQDLLDFTFWNVKTIEGRCGTLSQLAKEHWLTILNEDESEKKSEEDEQLDPEIDDE